MAHRIGDRIKELATTTGTGAFTLGGAVSGFVAFSTAMTANGDTTWYCAQNGAEWEVGLGTRTSATAIARTTVLASSNAGALVNFTVAPTVFSTVPAAKMAPLGAPAFSATRTAAQTGLVNGALTKMQLNSVEFDTNGCYDGATNFRFTPTVAGYYNVTVVAHTYAAAMTSGIGYLYKNGVKIANGTYSSPVSGSTVSTVSKLVYMNGTTDYLEAFAQVNAPSGSDLQLIANTAFMCASMVRSA